MSQYLYVMMNSLTKPLHLPASTTIRSIFGYVTLSLQHTSSLSYVRSFHEKQPKRSFSNLPHPDGLDLKHWLVEIYANANAPSDRNICQDIGYGRRECEVEARNNIYSVSTKYYYAFGACISEIVAKRLKELPEVKWVVPDYYLDKKNKDYGGEPFINGQPVLYHPKYHAAWLVNHKLRIEGLRYYRKPNPTFSEHRKIK